MLTIRFHRSGRRNDPSFKIVVTDKRKSSTGGRFVEQVGFYNPVTKQKILKGERVKYWISVGAQPSPTVHNLLISEKIIEGKKIPKHKKPKQPAETRQTVPASGGIQAGPPPATTSSDAGGGGETTSQAPAEVKPEEILQSKPPRETAQNKSPEQPK